MSATTTISSRFGPSQEEDKRQETMPSTTSTSNAESKAGTFTLLLFASASTYTSTETLMLPAPSTLRSVFKMLEARFPGFTEKILKSSAVTVNLEYVDLDFDFETEGKEEENREEGKGDGWDMLIQTGDEVGVIPPVSSG
ncbi:uncharacterized protein Z518_02384 [Rhinocladiella mackenziei CBS 650.93]|uniref:MOCS2A n=1 Tax=Rhinocladiella mackenziei CBS 650.93 TaxID=1442369 RepID=A0A0D2JEV6_9EURO|nr:uncharacterized protein Z518_02384 [Rhinocladiella mackenziei CBS 650.93]KIX07730.1 hypothetical protein Z518_02384 [Rhinocladiella mackenziei CBS 650.93]